MDNENQLLLKKKDEKTTQQKENNVSPVKSFTPPPSGVDPIPVQKMNNPIQLMQDLPAGERPEYFKPNYIQQLQALPENERPEILKPNLIQTIQRKKAEEKEEVQMGTEIQKKLPKEIQAKMEKSFGKDFSNVEIFEGNSASNINALAYTQGNRIHFAPGQFNPHSQHGQELLGHELTHVLQQQSGLVSRTTQAKGLPINNDPSLEKEADEIGKMAAQGKVVQGKFLEKFKHSSEVVQKQENTKDFSSKEILDVEGTDHFVTREYYVHDKNALIRENEKPHKFTAKKIPIGTKVNFIQFSNNKSLVEVEIKHSGEHVWTSFGNLTEVKLVNDNQEYRVLKNGMKTFVNPFDTANNCTVLNQDEYLKKTERCGIYVRIKSGGNDFGWIKESDLLKKPKDTSDNFNSFESISDWTELDKVDQELLTKIENNRNNINDRTDVETFGKGGGKSLSKFGSGHYYAGKDTHHPIPNSDSDIDKKIKNLIIEELFGEGGYSSINTYDAEVFTYGKGFAAGGELPKILNEIYTNKKYKQILLEVGIGMKDGNLVIVDTDGTIKTGSTKSVSQLIKKDTRLLSFFIELGEKKEYSKDIAEAQMNVLSDSALKYPDYVADKEKNNYKDSWNDSSITLLAHLSHWAGAKWSFTDYSDTKGDMAEILYTYFSKSLEKAKVMKSKQYENTVLVWNEAFEITSRLKQFGKPKGVGYQKYTETWGNSHLKELEFKDNKVYIKDSVNVLKNVILIKEGSKYRIITKPGDNLDTYTIKEEKK